MSPEQVVGVEQASANVAQLLADVAETCPGRPALVGADGTVRFTFSELAQRAARVAAGLVARGVRPGDRVALLVRDPEEALVPAVAALWAGGTLVVPPRGGGWGVALMAAARARPVAVIAGRSTWLVAAAADGLRRAPVRVSVDGRGWPGVVSIDDIAVEAAPVRPAPGPAPVPRRAGAPALVSWTSGTTGPPRAIVRSHGVLAAQHVAIRRLRAPRPDDVDLAGLPTIALHDLACGVAVVMPPRPDTDRHGVPLHEVAARAGVTTAAGFPALFERLVDGAPRQALSRLRSAHIGGAPAPLGLLDRLGAAAPGAAIVVVYGATEVEPIAAIAAGDLRASVAAWSPGHGLIAGRVCDGIELRLAPLEGPDPGPAASARRCGRILVRGPRVARDPVRSDADGWLDTGDVGSLDEEGRIWLQGRASNVTGGGIPPAEIEEPVAALADVRAAVVVAVPGGDRPRAILAIEPSTTAAAATVRSRASELASARGWQLDRVIVVRRLPRDAASGKIDYRRLRAGIR